MFFLNGLKNIKIILTISLFFFLIASTIIVLNLKITKKAEISFICSNQGARSDLTIPGEQKYSNYCNKFKKILDDRYENIYGKSQYLNITFLEPDNFTYINSLGKLNEINFEKKKILTYLEKNDVNIRSLLNYVSFSLSKPDFMSTNRKKFVEEISELKVLEFLRQNQIHGIEFISFFSKLYTSIFNNNQYLQLFVIIINSITLIIISLFVFYIFKQFLKNNNKLIYFLVLFVILNPLNIFYFFSFYKEPFLILFFLGLLVNSIYLNNNSKDKFIPLINSFLFLLILFLMLLEIKDVYFLPSIFGLMMCYILLIYKKKSNLYKLFYILKIFLLTLLLMNINNYYSVSPHNISNNRLSEFSDIQLNKTEQKIQKIIKKVVPKYETNKETFEKKEEKFYVIDPAYQKKYIKELEQYEKDVFKLKNFEHYDCNSDSSNNQTVIKICKKINSILYKIYKLKLSTISENKQTNKENIIKGYKFNGANDVLKSLPIAFVKSHLMPLNLNSNIKIMILSIYKIILLLFSIIFIYKLTKSKNIFITLNCIVIFLPLLTSIDLISTNFFTYFRYVLPYNFYLNIIAILGFLTIFNNNDKYFHKFRS
jgi:hypothetical protein